MIISNCRVRNVANRLRERVNRSWIAFPPIPADGQILFYKRDREDFGYLSNFYISPVEIEGVRYPHTEAYYQSQKSYSLDYRARILEKDRPSWSKYVGDSRLGHPKLSGKSWFRQRPEDLRADWDEVKLSVMRTAVRAKFTQNRNLMKALMRTDDAKIIEDSASDEFWGCGSDGSGKNWLGVILMECRA